MIALNLLFGVLFAIASGFPAPHVEASSLTVPDLQAMAMAEATSHHLTNTQMKEMLGVITCESNWQVDAVSPTKDYGIAQWHIQSHGMTLEQANDPEYALQQMAVAWQNGHEEWWSCYRSLYARRN